MLELKQHTACPPGNDQGADTLGGTVLNELLCFSTKGFVKKKLIVGGYLTLLNNHPQQASRTH